jgi:hypothetical protein
MIVVGEEEDMVEARRKREPAIESLVGDASTLRAFLTEAQEADISHDVFCQHLWLASEEVAEDQVGVSRRSRSRRDQA